MKLHSAYVSALFVTTALCAASAASAQAAAPATAAPTVQEIVVTGSALPTTPDAVAVPVSTVNAAAIAKGGVNSNVLEILRKDLPSFAGRSNTGTSNANNTNQNTAGGSQLQLRNLDTLVLIDGRRSAIDAIAGLGGKTFVDVSAIPTAAIERVEVLADGSSAIYGSDAVGGVVNLILKHRFDGEEVGGRIAGADGGYSERSAYLIAGGEPIEGLNLTMTASYQYTDPLRQNTRPFSSPFYIATTSVPGVVGSNLLAETLNSPRDNNPIGPGNATATSLSGLAAGTYIASNAAGIGRTYDLSQFQFLLMRQEQGALATNFTADLTKSGNIVAFGGVEYAHNESFTQFLPRTTVLSVPATAPYDPLSVAVNGVVFGDTLAPKQYYNSGDDVRATIGLRGKFNALGRDWKWEGAFVHSEDDLTQLQKNVLFKPNLALAVAGGFDASGNPVVGGKYSKVYGNYTVTSAGPNVLQPALDPFARAGDIIPGSLANVLGTETLTAASQLDSVDFKVTGDIFSLPAGEIGLALGGAWRREALSAHTDPNGTNTLGAGAQNWIGGQFNDPFSHSRTVGAAFAEARAPITSPHWNFTGFHAFDLIGALRFEHYSDAGDSVVPKIGFRWEPVDSQVTFRGTYSKSYTAPSLYAEYGPTDTRIAGGAIIPSQAFPGIGLPQMPFQAEDGNNPHLHPAKADSFFLGVVIKPDFIRGLKISIDYSAVDERGIAGGIGFANILQDVNAKGSASQFYNNIAQGNFVGQSGASQFAAPGALLTYLKADNTAAGQIAAANNLFIIDRFTNLGGVKERSFNINVDYVRDTEKYGTFTFDTTGAIFTSYKFQALPIQPFYEYAGTATNGGTGVQGTLPKYHFYSSVDWSYQGWDVTLGNTFISSVQDLGVGGQTRQNALIAGTAKPPYPVKAYTAWDIRVQKLFEIENGKILKKWTIAAGVNNFTNAMPPLSPLAFTDNSADVASYSPIGRLFYVQASAKF